MHAYYPMYNNISRNSLIPRDESLGVGLGRAWEWDSGKPGSGTQVGKLVSALNVNIWRRLVHKNIPAPF